MSIFSVIESYSTRKRGNRPKAAAISGQPVHPSIGIPGSYANRVIATVGRIGRVAASSLWPHQDTWGGFKARSQFAGRGWSQWINQDVAISMSPFMVLSAPRASLVAFSYKSHLTWEGDSFFKKVKMSSLVLTQSFSLPVQPQASSLPHLWPHLCKGQSQGLGPSLLLPFPSPPTIFFFLLFFLSQLICFWLPRSQLGHRKALAFVGVWASSSLLGTESGPPALGAQDYITGPQERPPPSSRPPAPVRGVSQWPHFWPGVGGEDLPLPLGKLSGLPFPVASLALLSHRWMEGIALSLGLPTIFVNKESPVKHLFTSTEPPAPV